MNDIILSGLVNLFALFGAKNNLDKQHSVAMLEEYLRRFFGIRNVKTYINLYLDLRDYYDDFPELDKTAIIEGICNNLKVKMIKSERVTMLLRLMEFCSKESGEFNHGDDIFKLFAGIMEIDGDKTASLVDFICGRPGGPVKLIEDVDSDAGLLKTLYFEDLKLLVFSYEGKHSVFMNDIRVLNGVFQTWQQSSTLKSNHFKPMYFSTIMEMYSGGKSGVDSIELCGRDINFRFDTGGDNGMHNFSFTLRTGELVAIMGGSGVGKSTLLSLLNGSLRPQEGSITINGHDISTPEAKAQIGFVPQDDLLIEELTVYQNLWYTAKLCFDNMPEQELDARVMKVLVDLGLDAAKDLKVGSPINKYISGGQRKRLNIALELIREPAILYLDEPTSGLSSTDTEKVINILKELTYKGKLIVANIHQPSSDVYKLFDRLWLLDKGGYPIYDGNPIEAVSYFKMAANYADSRTSACPVCGNVNPESILNIVDEKAYDSGGVLSEQRKMTPKQWHELYLERRAEMSAPFVGDVPDNGQKRPNSLKQTAIFLRRNISTKITNLQYMLVTLLEGPLLALICALLTHFTPDGASYSLMDNKNFTSYMFMAIIVAIFLGMSGSAEEIIKDRALLKREKFLNLSYFSYIWSKVIYMAAVCLVQTFLFLLVGNSIIGVSGMFWIWWTVLFVSAFLSSLIGLLLSQTMNSVVAIYITIPILLIPQILLCGLVVNFEDLNPGSKTGNVPLIGEVIPSRWAYEALAVASFTMNDYEAQFYQKDRERFEALFIEKSFEYEIEARNETVQDALVHGLEPQAADCQLIRSELPYLTAFCGMEPYSGDYSYQSVDDYLSAAKKILGDKSNKTTLALDRQITAFVRENGMDKLTELKQSNYNLQLEKLVLRMDADHLYTVVGDRIVPRSGYIYLTPRTCNGRAPFYSGVKIVGKTQIPTLYFNLFVMLLMCILVGLCLFFDFPGKYLRKERS